MLLVMSMVTLIAAAVLSLRTSHARERKVIVSATIARPASTVFNVIDRLGGAPVWRRSPQWLPAPLRMTRMMPWGEFAQSRTRKSGLGIKKPEQIRIRHLKNRLIGYRSIRRYDLSFESTFRIAQEDGHCLVTWEIRYESHRLRDVLGSSALEAGVRGGMAKSLALIERLALTRPSRASDRGLIYEAQRGQISAA